jgi:hypothetical protein
VTVATAAACHETPRASRLHVVPATPDYPFDLAPAFDELSAASLRATATGPAHFADRRENGKALPGSTSRHGWAKMPASYDETTNVPLPSAQASGNWTATAWSSVDY